MNGYMKRLVLSGLVCLLSAAVVLAGCSSGTKSAKPGGTMVTTIVGDAVNLLPTVFSDASSGFVIGMLYDGLAVFDDKLEPHPAIADSWEIKDDRVYTFRIRKGVKFHDGTELTAKDVAFTFLSIAHPKYQGVRFGDFTPVKGWKELGDTYTSVNKDLDAKTIDQAKADELKLAAYEKFAKEGGIQTPDDYTFVVEAVEPFAPLFIRLAGYGIMPKHLLENDISDLKASEYATKPVGTGAFKIVEWVKDDHITLERNPDWKLSASGKGPMNIEKMVIKVIPDQQANMVALENGETDMANVIPEQFEHFKNVVDQVQLYEYMTYSYTYLGYNLPNPLFSDPRVRQAITHAINRQEIVDTLLQGHGQVANSHVTPVRWDYNPDVPTFGYDPEKAAKLLDEAGWTVGADGIREKDGQKLKFEIATNGGNKLREQSAVVIQEALKKVGIDVSVKLMEWKAFLQYVQSDQKQAYISGWAVGADPDAYSMFHTKGGLNYAQYSNPKVDELIMRGRVTTDQTKRKEIYGEMQKILAEDQAYTFLYYPTTITGLNKRVQGAKHGSPNGLLWNFEEWYITDTASAK